MKKSKYKNQIVLTNRKLITTYTLTDEQLEALLNDLADDLLYSRVFNDKHYRVKITSREIGIIQNNNIDAHCYSVLRKYVEQLNIIAIEKRD